MKDDEKGTVTKNITFTPISADGKWATLKSGTIAPFIGGIESITAEGSSKIDLQIYGTCEPIDRTAMKWDWNFLNDESITFQGTKRNDINFVGYTNISAPDFFYALKLVSGFEANPKMERRSGASTTTIKDTEYNVYSAD